MATEQASAAEAEAKMTMIPSPNPLTSLPPVAATACRNTEKYPRRTSSAASGDMASDNSVDPTTSEKRTAKFSVVTQHLLEHHVAGNPSRTTER